MICPPVKQKPTVAPGNPHGTLTTGGLSGQQGQVVRCVMAKELRLLLIEDSEDDAILLLHELKRGDYDVVCRRVDQLDQVRQALSEQWDVIISDYNLPQFTAPVALQMAQESGIDRPFIIVSGMIGEETAVAAMKAGAHDYLMKGALKRLIPAIEREMREAEERHKRREAERALKAQFSQISTIFDSLNVLVYVANLENDELIYLNRHGAQMMDGPWLGRRYFEALQPVQQEINGCRRGVELMADNQPTDPYVWEFQNRATSRWYQCIDRAIEWPDGQFVRMGIAVDITERKEMERLQDEMLSAVSHEMRTPLTAMLGFTEFLLENEVTPEQLQDSLATIHKETERLHNLISNFLDLQKHKARRDSYHFTAVAVLPLLEDTLALFAGGSEHIYVLQCPEDLPPVRGDETKLHQVLNNLISNAGKYSPVGSTITIGAEQFEQQVRIWVKDQGIGIPAEMREKIFEKFYRIDNTDRRQVGGTGLGLALVQEIICAHEGRIWIEANPAGGSIFSVALPLAR
jgi:signal transduction histidine kinase